MTSTPAPQRSRTARPSPSGATMSTGSKAAIARAISA
jgi:hypothetical protein